jgi:FkbM family methyltransferase
MYINLFQFKNSFSFKGVIQVGAHLGEEDQVYDSLGITSKIYLEPNKKLFGQLQEKIKNAILINKAAGDVNTNLEMFISSNDGMSSSLLEPDTHFEFYPHVKFDKKEIVEVIKLDELKEFDQNYNLLVMDVQGYELNVLKGAKQKLAFIDYIVTEVNKGELYKNCAKVWELEDFLSPYGFKIEQVNWTPHDWGDALFVKHK